MECLQCNACRVAPLAVELRAYKQQKSGRKVWRCFKCEKLSFVDAMWSRVRRYRIPCCKREFVGPCLYEVRSRNGSEDVEKAKMGIDRMVLDEDDDDEDDEDEDDEDEDEDDEDDNDGNGVKKEEGKFFC